MFDERRFKAQIVLKGMTMKSVAAAMGWNEATLYRKVARGGDFTRDEINRLIDLLGFDDPMAVFFARELA